MLPILALATLALTTPAPITVQFTKDSVYTKESIISPTNVVEQDDGLYTIVLEEDKLLGYCIYDKEDTAYVDGLTFDGEHVTNYVIKDVDLTVEHVLLVKTVYTEDVAGMLAAAKNGDWSIALSNPLILFQLFYYILAALSIILGGFGLLKSKGKKVKTNDEIASRVSDKASESYELFKKEAIAMFNATFTPVLTKLQTQNQTLIKAYMLAQSNDKNAKLALIDLLKESTAEDINKLSDDVVASIENSAAIKEKAKQEATKVVEDIVAGNFNKSDVRF